MRLFWKIYLAVFASFMATVACISYVASARQIFDAKHRISDEHQTIGALVTSDIERRCAESSWPFENLAHLAQLDDFLFWWIVASDGTIHLADRASFIGTPARGYFPDAISGPTQDGQVFLNRQKNCGVFMQSFGLGNDKWSFWLGFSTKEVSQAARKVVLSASLFSALALAALAIILYLTIEYFTAPIKALAEGAAVIGSGTLTHRVPVKSRDELGHLARSFNLMAEHLEITTTSIDTLNAEIARRNQAEEEIRASEERLKILFEYAPDAIYLNDLKGCFVDGNRAAEKLIGFDRAELVGKNLAEAGLLSAEQLPRALANLKKTADSKPTGPDEFTLKRKTGEQVTVEVRTFPVRIKGQTLSLGIARDVTERKQAESKLAYLASFPERNPNPIMEVDLDGNIRYANPATLRLFPDLQERGPAHPWLADWATVVDPFREGQTDTGVRDVTIGARSYEQLFHYFAQDHFVRVYGADITERKRAEIQIQQDAQIQAVLNKLLSLSLQDLTIEEMLEQAIDHITSVPWLLSSKGTIFLADKEQEMLVMTAQRGLPAPQRAGCAHVSFGECICGRAASSREIEFADRVNACHEHTFDGMSPHGHYCVPILSGGTVLGVINVYVEEAHPRSQKEEDLLRAAAAVVAGIIEREQAEKQQTQLLQQLAEINQELKDFAYIVSHDLKAPLRAIKTIADWLAADYADKLDTQGKEYLTLLVSRADRLQNLIDGVLQYSRIGRTEQATGPVDLSRLLPEIIESLGAPPHREVRIETDLPTVEADVTRITQVFQNLLSNALKYLDKPQGQITVACVEENGFWRFCVSDNGPGIEPKHFDRIFKLFQTLTPQDNSESTGIGLTIAKKIVEMYGGRIWVESQVGQGSAFFFTLPKRQTELDDARVQTNVAC